jgi:hypothetical protein
MKLMPMVNQAGEIYGYQFWCPGCETFHWAQVKADRGPVWGFNNDLERPTFTPSILCNGDQRCPDLPRCHMYVTDGNIQYLSDCTHKLAGQTIPIPELNEDGEPI